MIAVIWLIIFIIGKSPTLGSVTLRLALRNLSTNRLRTAITILALSAGMFALSSITFVGEGTRELLNIQLSRSFGGNVLVFPFPGLPSNLIKGAIDNALQDIDIDYRTTIDNYSSEITQRNGQAVASDNTVEITVWRSDKPDIYSGQPPASAGRMLTTDDAGQPRIVLPFALADVLQIDVGDRIQVKSAPDLELEVVGISGETEGLAAPSANLPHCCRRRSCRLRPPVSSPCIPSRCHKPS